MASRTLILNTNGNNLTGAATWALADAKNLVRNTNTTLGGANTVTSAAFAITNAVVVDGVLLWIKQNATSPTGTLKVDLQEGGVSIGSVTVNKADLPDSTNVIWGPTLFKLSATPTGDGAADYTIVLTTTGTVGVTYNINAAGVTNFTYAIRSTTAATPAASDDLYVTGELTGAGTHTALSVTMDSTANTAYGSGVLNSTTVAGGGIQVGTYGTLTYGTTASTNYVLRVNGDVNVYQFGTLSIGASGAEIPRNSSAVLEIQPNTLNTDFGLYYYDNAVGNTAGLSRSSGKNIAQTKLSADLASNTVIGAFTAGATNGSTVLTAQDATNTSPIGGAFTETTTNATHGIFYSGASVTNTTQVATVWLARGSGTHNRFMRLTMGNATVQSSVTNGFFVDIDLQLGTLGTVTAVGTGTATSASIVADGAGFIVRMVGKVASGAATPSILVNSCSAAATLSFAGVADQAFLFDHIAIVTAASLSDTTVSVVDDTGWLSGDVVAFASTSQATTETELLMLNANAGASSFTSAEYPCILTSSSPTLFTHNGTAPFQGEVGLITRNVKIRSTSTTINTFVYMAALATVTMSWTELYRLSAPGNIKKRGIEIDGGATANAKSITFCSIHDATQFAVLISAGSTSLNVTFSNNVTWNIGSSTFLLNGAFTNTDWTVSNNLALRNAATAFSFADIGGTCTGNTVAGQTTGFAFTINEGNAALGTFDSNTAHSSTGGMTLNSAGMSGTISNTTIWRTSSAAAALSLTAAIFDLTLTNLTIYGCNTSCVNASATCNIIIISGSMSGDTTNATANGVFVNGSNIAVGIFLDSIDFSGTGTGQAPCTNAINIGGSIDQIQGRANNCKFGALPNPLSTGSKANMSFGSYIGFEKYGQTAGDHRCEMKYGTLKTDTTIFNAASPAERMTPNTAAIKLESAPKTYGVAVPVANGTTVTVNVTVRKSAAGDGAAYTGNQPRLIQRANSALGQNSDVVLATYSAGTGSWNTLTGTSSSATDDGTWEFIVDCDGTAGWIDVDDWTFSSVASTSKGLKNWFNGMPEVMSGGGGGAFFSGSVG